MTAVSGGAGPCDHCGRCSTACLAFLHCAHALPCPLQPLLLVLHQRNSLSCAVSCGVHVLVICAECIRTDSPAWRRGPPGKPHLCNACGVRYLGKGHLNGYMPGCKARGACWPAAPRGVMPCRAMRPQCRSSALRHGPRPSRGAAMPRQCACNAPSWPRSRLSDWGMPGQLSAWYAARRNVNAC